MPETLRQARSWETRKHKYLAAGLCHACAAQAAWGHEQGFAQIRQPCAACRPLVDAFPVGAAGQWRKLAEARLLGATSGKFCRPQPQEG